MYMWIQKLNIKNVKSFESVDLNFSNGINVIVGTNNSGKSTILRSLLSFQYPAPTKSFLRKTESKGVVRCIIEDINSNVAFAEKLKYQDSEVLIPSKENTYSIVNLFEREKEKPSLWKSSKDTGEFDFVKMPFSLIIPDIENSYTVFDGFSNEEPNNLFCSYFSSRKANTIEFGVDEKSAFEENPEYPKLVSRFEKLSNDSHMFNKDFVTLYKEILGFGLGSITKDTTRRLGMYSGLKESIPLEDMGEGVTKILGILTSLLVDDNKVFLLEEIENDMHPKALKLLLEFIVKKSSSNQFIISTHSNIVLKYLGASKNSKIFKTNLRLPIPAGSNPTTEIVEVDNHPNERAKILEELGYDYFDFDLFKGYLILEERSAESIIKYFLIPTFAPKLIDKLATIEAKGIGNVESTFHDFYRLLVFIHTSKIYKEKAWVVVDGDKPGHEVIEKLKKTFDWAPDYFRVFSKPNFEDFYPKRFSAEVNKILAMASGREKNRQKGEIAKKVLIWVSENQSQAKIDFQESASEVISFLKEIESALE
jgi:AAA15 family ATPase/GTPase